MFVFVRALVPVGADDFFMYLALGRRLWIHGEFGATDPYIFTIPDFPWYLWHEWLSYLISYGTYSVGGFQGVMILRSLLVTLAAALVWKTGQRSHLPAPVTWIVLAFGFYIAHERCFGDRASLFSDVVITGLIYLLSDWDWLEARPKLKWGLPALFLLWIQLHPGYLIGWGVLGAFIASHFFFWSPKERREWILVFSLCVLLPALNPQGFYGLIYPLKVFLKADFQIFREINSEWMPTLPHYLLGTVYKSLLVVLLLLTLFLTIRDFRRSGPFKIMMVLLLAYLGLSAVRFVGLAGFGLAALILASLEPEDTKWRILHSKYTMRSAVALSCAALVFVLMQSTYGPRQLLQEEPVAAHVPLKAVRFLKALPPGNVFNEYDMGGLLAWELDGKMKIAGHGHLDQPALVMQNYFRFSYSREDWKRIIVDGQVKYFVAYTSSLIANPQAGWSTELGRSWSPIYQDERVVIFQNRRVNLSIELNN
ncbi:MAG: hypothetical protein AB7F86_08540 [Bdellovibrionales bacterium]